MGPVACPSCGKPELYMIMDVALQDVKYIECRACGKKFRLKDVTVSVTKEKKP
jgi:transcription elongation factor Elf1